MRKKLLWLATLNLAAIVCWFLYFDQDEQYYCGRLSEKPQLAFGLSPTWFDGAFQINKGYKEIIGSTSGAKPSLDRWVKGFESFRTIVAYDARKNASGISFRAVDWEGEEQVYVLRKYVSQDASEYIFEVIPQDVNRDDHEWKNVDVFSCRVGAYQSLAYLFLALIMVVDVAILFKMILDWARSRR